jgi:hypothetical protein
MICIFGVAKIHLGRGYECSRIVMILGVLEGLFYLIIVMGRVCRIKASPA